MTDQPDRHHPHHHDSPDHVGVEPAGHHRPADSPCTSPLILGDHADGGAWDVPEHRP